MSELQPLADTLRDLTNKLKAATERADRAWHAHRDAEETRQRLEDAVRDARRALLAAATGTADPIRETTWG